jgi:hypothetical protein
MLLSRGWLTISVIVLGLVGCKPDRGGEIVTCTPGTHIWVGCNAACSLGSCTGDPWIGICDGNTALSSCNEDTRIAENDDSTDICFSTCPIVRLVCPASGRITVTLRSERSRRSAFTCDWRVEERPPVSPSSDIDSNSDASTAVSAGDAS